MKIQAHSKLASNVQVIVSHGDESLSFMASVFTRNALHTDYDVFDHINRYWEQMPYAQQNEVWTIYKKVYRMFDEAISGDELYDFLNMSICELLRLHPLHALETFLAMDSSVTIPENVKREYIESNEDNNSRDKTYTHKDYMQLIALSLFLRTLVPIWGHYVFSIRKETGMETKEYVAFQLLINTGLLESDAMKKLAHYINQITKERRNSLDKIMNAVSSEDMGFMLLALVCTRRLSVTDIRGQDPKTQPISRIYKYLFQKVFNSSERDSFLKEKKYGEANAAGGDQSKRSLMESFRKRTELSLGEVAELEFGYENYYGIAERLVPGISRALIDECVKSAQNLYLERVGDAQLVILSWVVKTLISPKSVFYISKSCLCNALGMAEAVLWHMGHRYLATIVTSHLVIGVEEMSVSQIDTRMQLPEDLAKEITKYYPFQWTTRRRKAGINDVIPDPHPVLYAIDLLMDELMKNAWRKTASEEKILEAYGKFERKLRLRSETKADLAKLLIDLEARRSVVDSARPVLQPI